MDDEIGPAAAELLTQAHPATRRRAPLFVAPGTAVRLIRFVEQLQPGSRSDGLYWASCRARDAGLLPLAADDLVSAAVRTGLPEKGAPVRPSTPR